MESSTSAAILPEIKGERIKVNVNFKKQSNIVEIGTDNTLGDFRLYVAAQTGVAAGLQKLMFKGAFLNFSLLILEEC
jgi:hypothetical protein